VEMRMRAVTDAVSVAPDADAAGAALPTATEKLVTESVEARAPRRRRVAVYQARDRLAVSD